MRVIRIVLVYHNCDLKAMVSGLNETARKIDRKKEKEKKSVFYLMQYVCVTPKLRPFSLFAQTIKQNKMIAIHFQYASFSF